jgi:hypothetical protein
MIKAFKYEVRIYLYVDVLEIFIPSHGLAFNWAPNILNEYSLDVFHSDGERMRDRGSDTKTPLYLPREEILLPLELGETLCEIKRLEQERKSLIADSEASLLTYLQ